MPSHSGHRATPLKRPRTVALSTGITSWVVLGLLTASVATGSGAGSSAGAAPSERAGSGATTAASLQARLGRSAPTGATLRTRGSDPTSAASRAELDERPTARARAAGARSTSAHRVPAARYRLWMAIGRSPSSAQLAAAAGTFAVVVLNSWDAPAARALRARDSEVVLLAYQDLSSVRSYDGASAPATGVAYAQATASGWVAADVHGDPIGWRGYAGHLQAATWEPGYRAQWVASAVRTARTAPWDGIYADNDMFSLGHYSGAFLAGTTSARATDAKIRASLDTLVDQAGAALRAQGRTLVPNYSDGRLDLARWSRHARWGGAQDENFVSWGSTGTPDVWDWGSGGWSTQRAEPASGPATLAITHAAPGDLRTLTYGYATFLLGAAPGDAWQGTTDSSYTSSAAIPAQAVRLGPPAGPAVAHGGGWSRSFAGGWVAVNPSRSPLTIKVPAGMLGAGGHRVTSVRLSAMSGTVLARG